MNDAQHGKNFATADHTGTADYCSEKSCSIAAALARLGNATDAYFLLALNTTLPEFRSWKREHPEFAEAVRATPTPVIQA